MAEPLSDKSELLFSALETSLRELQKSPMQIHGELIILRDHLHTTRSAVQDAERKLQFKDKLCLPDSTGRKKKCDRKLDFLVKLWLADPRKLQFMEKLGLIDARKHQFVEKLRPSDTTRDIERKLQHT
ncbi:hypothetical protein SLA2020_048010 [Shorea laevis]